MSQFFIQIIIHFHFCIVIVALSHTTISSFCFAMINVDKVILFITTSTNIFYQKKNQFQHGYLGSSN